MDASRPARALFGAMGDLGGKRLAALVAPADAWRIRSALQQLLARADGVDVHVRPASGSRPELVRVRVRVVHAAESGGLFCWSARQEAAAHELEAPEQARLAADLARSHDQSQRELRARDRFMATLAHELRTPLNAILGYVRMLRAGQLAPEDHDRAFQTIEQSALAQAGLITDIMEAARMGEGKVVLRRAPLDLAALVEREVYAARPTANSRGVALGLDVRPSSCAVEGDAARLAQAVSNLLSNAIPVHAARGLR